MYYAYYGNGEYYNIRHFFKKDDAQKYIMSASEIARNACANAQETAPKEERRRFQIVVTEDQVIVKNPENGACFEEWYIGPVIFEDEDTKAGDDADQMDVERIKAIKQRIRETAALLGEDGKPLFDAKKDLHKRLFSATLKLPARRMAILNEFLSGEVIQGEGRTEMHSVRFPDGMVMDLKVCGCDEDPSWAESVLLAPTSTTSTGRTILDEVACSGVEDDFIGPSELEYNGTNYVVDVVDGGDIDAPILIIMENPLKENLCDWAVDGKPVIPEQVQWVAVARSGAVRDVQVCTSKKCDLRDDDSWKDWGQAEVYLGVFRGAKAEAMKAAQEFAGIDPGNITLYQI